MPARSLGSIACLFLLLAGPVRAQGTARVLDIDPSARSSGMGSASAAVFWGSDQNVWANPALLGSARGLRYEWGKAESDLEDARLRSHRLTVGFLGAGIFTSGRPDGFGVVKLDGAGAGPDFEEVHAWGFGVNAAEFIEEAFRLGGVDMIDLDRYGDAAYGRALKKVRISNDAGDQIQAGSTHDRGFLVRITPYDAFAYPGRLPGLETRVRARLDVSYGDVVLNSKQTTLFGASTPRMPRRGWAVRLAATPAAWEDEAERRERPWMAEIFSPLVSIGAAWDRQRWECPDGNCADLAEARGSGWEVSVGNVLAYRRGRTEDPGAGFEADTHGWSVGFRMTGIAGIRYDRATVKQVYASAGRSYDETRSGLVLFVDPIGIWSRWFDPIGAMR